MKSLDVPRWRENASSMIVIGAMMIAGIALYGYEEGKMEVRGMQQDLQRNRFASKLARTALSQQMFLNTLSAKDALVWTLLAKEGREAPGGGALVEYRDEKLLKSVPIITTFSGEGAKEYIVVVGVRIYRKDGGPTGYAVPALGYYVDDEHGLTRLNRLTDDESGDVIRRGNAEPRSPEDWVLFKTNLEEHLLRHIGAGIDTVD